MHISRYHGNGNGNGIQASSQLPFHQRLLAHLATFMLYTHIARSLSEASHFGLGIQEFGIYGDTICCFWGGSWLGDLGVWGFEGREGEGCI